MKRKGFVPLDQDANDVLVPKGAVNFKSKLSLPLPPGWDLKKLTSTQTSQGLRLMALNTTLDAGTIVSSVKRSAVTDVTKYIETRRAKARAVGVDGDVTEATQLQVNGKDAFRFYSKNTVGPSRYRYAYTQIVGDDEIALIMVWTIDGNFDGVGDELLAMANELKGL